MIPPKIGHFSWPLLYLWWVFCSEDAIVQPSVFVIVTGLGSQGCPLWNGTLFVVTSRMVHNMETLAKCQMIFHQPGSALKFFGDVPEPKRYISGENSCEVAIIWPDCIKKIRAKWIHNHLRHMSDCTTKRSSKNLWFFRSFTVYLFQQTYWY